MSDQNKVLLAITGGIAAYKSAELCRQLVKSGYDVRVVMTHGACEFISPLTLQALSGNAVHTELLDPEAESGMGHIELAKWPDLILVAPASAHFVAQYASGLAGDLLLTLLLASEAPVAIAPAMNQAMWKHPVTRRNLRLLQEAMGAQLTVMGPGQGEQACGDIGPGRMLEPEEILQQTQVLLHAKSRMDMQNVRVVITAGPTREALDPVRYISNHSSGKMGFALAQACQQRGAHVVLVAGPVNLETPAGVSRLSVDSAEEMLVATRQEVDKGCDLFIAAAAVADYRPASLSEQKIKKQSSDAMTLELVQNPDIVATIAGRSEPRPFVVGFAAETNNVLEYAKSKLSRKNLDMIVANDVSRQDIGFNSDSNAVHVLSKDSQRELSTQLKATLAHEIVDEIIASMNN